MHLYSYINSAKEIISTYDGKEPFASWIKSFFAAHKKYGSKDRKHISQLCYSFFRLGNAFELHPLEDKILIAQFLTSTASNIYLQQLKPEWNKNIDLLLTEKFHYLKASEEWQNIFPFISELSQEIEKEDFVMSFFIQPDLFLRIRPRNEVGVKKKLDEAGVQYVLLSNNTLVLPKNFKATEVLEVDNEVVVQDLNSQQVLNSYFEQADRTKQITAWDCCAASGGKSLLLNDIISNVQLTVTDIRKSILYNLHSRFKRAGIKNYASFVDDVSRTGYVSKAKYDFVICDAPCSGSGTWSRTPEQLLYFNEGKISHYQQLQKNIVFNASEAVKSGGNLLYITCSVFKKENEDVVEYILERTPLKLINKQYYKGYGKRADTLFAALFSF